MLLSFSCEILEIQGTFPRVPSCSLLTVMYCLLAHSEDPCWLQRCMISLFSERGGTNACIRVRMCNAYLVNVIHDVFM